MAKMQLRKAPENPTAGGGWSLLAFLLLLFGLLGMLVTLTRPPAPAAALPVTIIMTLVGIISLVLGIRAKAASVGPVLLEIDPTELRDLRTGDTIRWADVNTVKQVGVPGSQQLEIVHHGNVTQTVDIFGLGKPAELIATTAIDLHRKSQGKQSLAVELHEAGATILCPVCSEESDSVKCYHYIFMLFAIVGYGYKTIPQVGCPSCTRGMIGKNLLVNILTANLVWPIICLPWGIVLFLMSFTKGHSRSVLKTLAEGVVASGHESKS